MTKCVGKEHLFAKGYKVNAAVFQIDFKGAVVPLTMRKRMFTDFISPTILYSPDLNLMDFALWRILKDKTKSKNMTL